MNTKSTSEWLEFIATYNDKSSREKREKEEREGFIRLVRQMEAKSPDKAIVSALIHNLPEEFLRLFEKIHPPLTWVDEYNNSLMHIAIGGTGIAIIKFLKEKGFSIHHLGRYNRTPLMEACMYRTSGRQEKKKMREIIIYLLDNGALTSPIDDSGHNALYYAEQEHYDKELCIALTPPTTN